MAPEMSEMPGTRVILENTTGAAGVAHARADRNTPQPSGPMAIRPFFRHDPSHCVREFAQLCQPSGASVIR